VDLSTWFGEHGGLFLALRDPKFFSRVSVDREAGTIVWPNGVDAPGHAVLGRPRILIEEAIMPWKRLTPIHPGEILLHDFLEPLGMPQYRLAKSLKVPARRINEIVNGVRAVSADTALRLARFFATSDRLWLNLQAAYDLEVERDRVGARIAREVPVFRKAG
jgi:addiction module HigA family antidote